MQHHHLRRLPCIVQLLWLAGAAVGCAGCYDGYYAHGPLCRPAQVT